MPKNIGIDRGVVGTFRNGTYAQKYHGVGGCKFANIEKYFWYFSMKKGGPGCIFANSEKYFWYFFTFFSIFFSKIYDISGIFVRFLK